MGNGQGGDKRQVTREREKVVTGGTAIEEGEREGGDRRGTAIEGDRGGGDRGSGDQSEEESTETGSA